MLKRCLGYLSVVRGRVAAGIILLLAAATLEVALPWPVKWLIDGVFGSQGMPEALSAIPGFAEGDPVRLQVISLAVMIVLLGIAHKALTMLSQLLIIRAGNDMVARLRLQTLEKLYDLPLSYHDKAKVGDLMYRSVYDTYALQSMLSGVFVPVFSGICLAVGVVVVMLQIDLVLTAITLATAPLLWLNLKRFERAIEERSKRFHESESGLSATVQEALGSIRVIQAFTLQPGSNRRIAEQTQNSVDENMAKSRVELAFSLVVGLIMSAGTALVIYLGAMAVVEGRLYPGDILLFLAYLGTLYQPLNAFSQGASVYHAAAAQLGRVFAVLDEAGEIQDDPGAETFENVQGAIQFSGVHFAYDPRKPVIQELDLEIPAGEIFALMGRTGSGKTSLLNLLLRFYDPDQGLICLDGKPLRDLQLSWLRRQISIVFQEPILFSATIRENIGIGDVAADQAAIELAARRAQAHEFITQLPDGYETMLGERGVNLSGGQRQRLAIARALLKDAPIVVFDEPTSALDACTESDLLLAMEALMQDRTVIIIAHRGSTIRHADRVGIMQAGRLVEVGTPSELGARTGSLYSQLSAEPVPHATSVDTE